MTKSRKEKWQKVLYIQQKHPDNYVDKSFLKNLQKNQNIQTLSYFDLTFNSLICITPQLSVIFIFIAIFINLYNERLESEWLILASFIYYILCSLFWAKMLLYLDPNYQFNIPTIIKSNFVIISVIVGLAPMIKSLTLSISSDSIWALTVIMLIMNALFFDYSWDESNHLTFPNSISTNAAISTAVLLASRLSSPSQVVGLMSFAIISFSVFPMFLKTLWNYSKLLSAILPLLMFSSVIMIYTKIELKVVQIYVLFMVFVVFVCPAWLIWAQRYKNNISGPWDEAKPKIKTN